MAEVKWIKLFTDIFNNRKIKQIKKMPEGKSLVIIWLHLLCLAGETNDNGLVYFSKDIPYTEDMLAVEFEEDVRVIRLALSIFQKFSMIEVVDNFLLVSNWEKYQNVESLEKIKEQNRLRVARHREKQKLLVEDVENKCNVTVTLRNAIEEERREKKEDKDIYIAQTQFDKFWECYPKKVAKDKVLSWFKKNKPNDELLEQMLNTLEKYKKSQGWQDKQFIPHPTTWLNQKRWEDEVDLTNQTKTNFNNKKVAQVPDWYANYEKELEEHEKKKNDKKNDNDILIDIDDVL